MIRFKFDGKFKGKFDGDFSGRFNRWRSATKSEPRLPRLGCRKAAAPSFDASRDAFWNTAARDQPSRLSIPVLQ